MLKARIDKRDIGMLNFDSIKKIDKDILEITLDNFTIKDIVELSKYGHIVIMYGNDILLQFELETNKEETIRYIKSVVDFLSKIK